MPGWLHKVQNDFQGYGKDHSWRGPFRYRVRILVAVVVVLLGDGSVDRWDRPRSYSGQSPNDGLNRRFVRRIGRNQRQGNLSGCERIMKDMRMVRRRGRIHIIIIIIIVVVRIVRVIAITSMSVVVVVVAVRGRQIVNGTSRRRDGQHSDMDMRGNVPPQGRPGRR